MKTQEEIEAIIIDVDKARIEIAKHKDIHTLTWHDRIQAARLYGFQEGLRVALQKPGEVRSDVLA